MIKVNLANNRSTTGGGGGGGGGSFLHHTTRALSRLLPALQDTALAEEVEAMEATIRAVIRVATIRVATTVCPCDI
jgi:hypothetical protein